MRAARGKVGTGAARLRAFRACALSESEVGARSAGAAARKGGLKRCPRASATHAQPEQRARRNTTQRARNARGYGGRAAPPAKRAQRVSRNIAGKQRGERRPPRGKQGNKKYAVSAAAPPRGAGEAYAASGNHPPKPTERARHGAAGPAAGCRAGGRKGGRALAAGGRKRGRPIGRAGVSAGGRKRERPKGRSQRKHARSERPPAAKGRSQRKHARSDRPPAAKGRPQRSPPRDQPAAGVCS